MNGGMFQTVITANAHEQWLIQQIGQGIGH
jgi:hypothetical protein